MTPEILGQEYDVNGYYFDYTCGDCGQQGTARFKPEHVEVSEKDGWLRAIPKKIIYCCECGKSGNITIDEWGDY